ncbi:hypothetical protein BDZ91DRAFT_793341 [Kalaharituber pfeilii]|nr:hypothetical protein BDZ91DRAFT_793341 [Kalaharituber pfeilii]
MLPTSPANDDDGELYRVVSPLPAPSAPWLFGLTRVFLAGRGGAGNIGEDIANPDDKVGLPHITSPVYTTGRGGTGNMALNDPNHPEYARAAQDVELSLPRPSSADVHGGRGGAGNVYHPAEGDTSATAFKAEGLKSTKPPPVDHSKIDYRGWADKGKDLLFGRSKNNR